MIRSVGTKVAWVGRTASMVFGLALVLALIFGVATMALGANGQNFILGKAKNAATKVTGLVGNVDGASLRVTNPNTGTNDTALQLKVQAGEAPMKVNSNTRVDNLNADQLDGQDSSQFVPTNTDSFVRNNTYRTESAIGAGQDLGDGTFRNNASCFAGDVMLSGGPANVNPTSDMVESFPASTSTWAARIHKNGAADNFNVVVLCANQ